MKKLASLFAVFALLLALAAPGAAAEAQPETGRIYLYGETHATQAHLDQELAAWNDYYHQQGLRDLFIEAPSYAADFLNLWMQAEDDAILSRLYEDWEGTAMYAQETWLFYKAIKEQCPETVFHGFDVGHQYNSTGSRYLIVLMLTGQMGSADWQQTQQTIGQGRAYYQNNQDAAYRENMMAQNFARAFDALPAGSSVMAITGSLHSNLYTMDAFTGTTPCMANQLRQRYGDALVSRNLTAGVDYARAGETVWARRTCTRRCPSSSPAPSGGWRGPRRLPPPSPPPGTCCPPASTSARWGRGRSTASTISSPTGRSPRPTTAPTAPSGRAAPPPSASPHKGTKSALIFVFLAAGTFALFKFVIYYNNIQTGPKGGSSMLEDVFQAVYTKFKLHFYQKVFHRFATREATLTTVESFCMEGIMALGEPTIAEFSRMMQISTPNAAYKIGSLVRKGYVEKIQSTTDRREYHLRPTQKYIDYYSISYSYLHTVIERVRERFSPADVAKLEEMLTIINDELMPELQLPARKAAAPAPDASAEG